MTLVSGELKPRGPSFAGKGGEARRGGVGTKRSEREAGERGVMRCCDPDLRGTHRGTPVRFGASARGKRHSTCLLWQAASVFYLPKKAV